MNILLQFKQKSHSEAYSHDLQLQVTKRLIMVIIWAVISVGGTIATFAVIKTVSMSPFDIAKMATIFATVGGLTVLRCNLQKAKKYLGLINIVLDLCLVYAQIILYPLVDPHGLDPYGKLGAYTFGWCACLGCYATYFAIANWWLKAIVPILQIVYYLVPTAEEEMLWQIITILAIECMVIYACEIYVYEWYQRKDFLEKRKVYENYEAIMRIFDDINQGVMIVDPSYHLIYSNQTIKLMFNQSKDNQALDDLLSQIQVKLITPSLETLKTERIRTSHEHEDSENEDTYNTLKDYMDIISKVLFLPNTSEPSVTAETFWRDPNKSNHNQQQQEQNKKKKNFSIKFTTSLFMNKQVIVVNVTDTTDRDSLIAAQASSDHKSRLLSSVSHELRTPLNGSINFIEQSLLDTTIPNVTKEKWLVPALRSNRLLLSLVNDILDFSQMHAGKLRLVFEPRSIVETAKECIELVEIQAAKKNLKLTLQNNLPSERKVLTTDHNRLRQVMLNLLSNSVKFTLKGEVSLILDESSVVLPQQDQNGGTLTQRGVRVTCKDTGIGISDEDQKKLFQAFEKIDLGNRASINATGTGLGLLISNNLVQRLSPQKESQGIRFESKVDEGTSFYFDVHDREVKRGNIQHIDLEKSAQSDDYIIFSEKGLDLKNLEELSRPISFSTAYRSSARGFLERNSRSQGLIQAPHILESQISSTSQIPHCECPKILLVDDDPFNLTALEQILSRLNISCHLAFNGKEAIQKIEARQHNRCSPACQQYKVIFLDCNMPILDGFETSKILRQMTKRGEIDELKIIACTAFVQQADEENAKQAGMDDFCTKPIKSEGIKDKLKAVGFYD